MYKYFLISCFMYLLCGSAHSQSFFTVFFSKLKLKSAGVAVTETSFLQNYRAGHEDTVSLLLKAGINPDTYYEGNPVLLDACWQDYKHTAKHLIMYGADVNVQGEETPLKGLTPLICTALQGKDTLTRKLLNAGADPELKGRQGITPLIVAACKGDFKRILEIDSGDSSYMHIEAQKYEHITAMLLAHDANPDISMQEGVTPLLIASGRGYKKIVKHLLDADANPDKGNQNTNPLIAAASNGFKETAEILLEAGADPDQRGKYGITPLMAAVIESVGNGTHPGLVRLLVEHDADMNVQEKQYGMTALMFAAAQGNPEVVEILLDKGATAWVENDNHMTALQLAYQTGNKEVINLLEDKQKQKQEQFRQK